MLQKSCDFLTATINPVPPARKWRPRSEFNRAARDLVGVKCKDVVSLVPG
jgi:hypothetical protein